MTTVVADAFLTIIIAEHIVLTRRMRNNGCCSNGCETCWFRVLFFARLAMLRFAAIMRA